MIVTLLLSTIDWHRFARKTNKQTKSPKCSSAFASGENHDRSLRSCATDNNNQSKSLFSIVVSYRVLVSVAVYLCVVAAVESICVVSVGRRSVNAAADTAAKVYAKRLRSPLLLVKTTNQRRKAQLCLSRDTLTRRRLDQKQLWGGDDGGRDAILATEVLPDFAFRDCCCIV